MAPTRNPHSVLQVEVQPTASTSDSSSSNGNGKLKKAKKPIKSKAKGGSKSSTPSSSEPSSPAASHASTPVASTMEATYEEPDPVPAGVVVGESFDEEDVKRQTGSSGISSGLRLENVSRWRVHESGFWGGGPVCVAFEKDNNGG